MNVNENLTTVLKAVTGNGIGGPQGINLEQLKAKNGGMDFELMMAQKLFQQPKNQEFSMENMDMGVMNNSLVLEALTALNSVQKKPDTSNSLLKRTVDLYRKSFPQHSHAVNKLSSSEVHEGVTGELSAKFESGDKGVGSIGYDRVGGTSYGKYQIASKTGTMDSFIKFLKGKSPDMAAVLEAAGEANTGSKNGKMPEVWKSLAQNFPNKFEKLQHDFIKKSHYDPAVKMIQEATGIDLNRLPKPVKEVLWSTSVQHGATGASKLVAKALDSLAMNAEDKGFSSELVKEIYGQRGKQFTSSTTAVQNSVKNRFKEEQELVLSMLGKKNFSATV